MADTRRWRHSLKQKLTLGIVAIFVLGIWGLSYYVTRMLREDLKELLANQQVSTVSYVAAELNQALSERIQALQKIAQSIDRSMLSNPAALQKVLGQQPVFEDFFNAGVVVVNRDGIAVADAPIVAGRRGTSYASNEATHLALTEGKTVIGRPVIGRVLKQALFNINTPVRDADGTVIGALFGVINLARPSFLDRIGEQRYGKSGGYLVIAPQYNLFVTATDKSRVMQPLPPPGTNAMFDKRVKGYDLPEIALNSLGVETLSSAARIPVAGWFVVATLPTEEAFSPIHDMQHRIVLAASFLTLIAGILSWWLLRSQLSPLVDAASTLNQMTAAGKPLSPLAIAKQDEIGQLIGGFNELLDTLRRRETQLQSERDFFSALLQQSSDGVLLYRADDLAIHEVNPSLCRMLGYERDALLGMTLSDLVQAGAGNARADALHMARLRGERSYRKRDGTTVYFEVTVAPVEAGGSRLFMATLRDITERMEKWEWLESQVQERTAQLRAMAVDLTAAEERERHSVAQDLHDGLGQILAVAKLKLSALDFRQHPEDSGKSLQQEIREIEALLGQANNTMRSLSLQLSPPVLQELDLLAALHWLADEVERSFGLRVNVSDDGSPKPLDENMLKVVFRAARELLINAAKHAQADAVDLEALCEDGHLVLSVADTGVGFNPASVPAPSARGGYGLFSVRDRMGFIGGTVQIDSSPGNGTVVVIRVPLRTQNHGI